MKTMKKFLLYLVLFILLYLFIDSMTYLMMKNTHKEIKNYNLEEGQYKIEILESKAGYANTIIKGTVTNNTNELKDKIYIKIDFYNKNRTLLGTKYEEIKYLNVGETQKFGNIYKVTKTNTYNISIVDKIEEENTKQDQIQSNIIIEVEKESNRFTINQDMFFKAFLVITPIIALWVW